MPHVKPAGVLLKAAQRVTINGVQVVRIPVATNAAIYFTKENDSLKVYAYKWIYTNANSVYKIPFINTGYNYAPVWGHYPS